MQAILRALVFVLKQITRQYPNLICNLISKGPTLRVNVKEQKENLKLQKRTWGKMCATGSKRSQITTDHFLSEKVILSAKILTDFYQGVPQEPAWSSG